MEIHPVDAMAIAVVGLQHRRMTIGERGLLLHLGGAELPAVLVERRFGPLRAAAPDGFAERGIRLPQVVVRQRRRLVFDEMRHGSLPAQPDDANDGRRVRRRRSAWPEGP
jgi:hypothetical protein